MKLLCLCSALDTRYRFGCTPVWWQFLKGLHELGHDVIAIPYFGPAFDTVWWRAYANPCHVEGQAYFWSKKLLGSGKASSGKGAGAGIMQTLIDAWIRPRWQSQLTRILEKEGDVDAVIFFTVPLNHFKGVANRLRRQFNVPFFFFDGDVPASLPRFGGFASGFRIYDGADLSEYDGFMCNSQAGAAELIEMGAKRVQTVHWGVDPELYAPLDIPEDRDIFFYGLGAEFREQWIESMLIEPSRRMPESTFALSGSGFAGDFGNVSKSDAIPFNTVRQASCRSRINLNIARETHANVFASSTLRPFELTAMARCMVTSPYQGMETWFDEPDHFVTVRNADEAVETYTRLLKDPATRREMGKAARQRVLERHTHRHRAAEIVEFVQGA